MSSAPAVVVVGAGPAGLAAVRRLVEGGIRPMLLDREPAAGGQVLREQALGLELPPLPGFDPAAGPRARSDFEALGDRVDCYPSTAVVGLEDHRLWAVGPSGEVDSTRWDRLVLCAGAHDREVPVPGWTLPGVVTLGAAQIALKTQGCAVGRRIACVGTGPLLYLTAAQHVAAGCEVAVVADTAGLGDVAAALPGLIADRARLALGIRCLWILHRARVPCLRRVTAVAVEGVDRVTGLVIHAGRRREVVPCDAVAIGFGLVPQTQILDLADAAMALEDATGLWLPALDGSGRTSVPGVYAAGDGAAPLGAEAAGLAGERAALAVLEDLHLPFDRDRAARLDRELARHVRFARAVARAFPFPARLEEAIADATVLCRCEGVTAGAIRAAVREFDECEVNRVKALTRCGMGRCQGRICGPTLARLVARASGQPLAKVGRLRTRAPVEPLPARARRADAPDASP